MLSFEFVSDFNVGSAKVASTTGGMHGLWKLHKGGVLGAQFQSFCPPFHPLSPQNLLSDRSLGISDAQGTAPCAPAQMLGLLATSQFACNQSPRPMDHPKPNFFQSNPSGMWHRKCFLLPHTVFAGALMRNGYFHNIFITSFLCVICLFCCFLTLFQVLSS